MDSRLSFPNNNVKSRRIASNTLVLFMRMFAIMVINLYAVRVVLHALGEMDYGIFNTIAGVVLTSTFLTSTLAISIQRFYSYAIGAQDTTSLSQIFTASMHIILLLVFLVLLIFETVGLWFVNTQLDIPSDRMLTTQWIYQFAILSIVFSFIQIPYTAAIFAHEDMSSFALVSLAECIGRLLVAFLISYQGFSDGLVFYGAGLAIVAFLIYAAYAIIGRKQYEECHYCKISDNRLYKEILSFSGWTTYSALSGISVTHGNTILLNIFFGPIITAAYAIANQIHNAMTALTNSIVIAFRPPMIKSYAENSFQYLDKLFIICNKFVLYLLLGISIPLIIELPVILGWWLGTSTEHMILFSRLYVIFMVVLALHNPITTIIHSTGKIKYYILWVDSITLLCLPITFVLFHLGFPDYFAFLSMISTYSIAHIIRLICLKHYYQRFSYYTYIRTIILPGAIVAVITALLAFLLHQSFVSEIPQILALFILSPICTFILAYAIGFSHDERLLLRSFIGQILKHAHS